MMNKNMGNFKVLIKMLVLSLFLLFTLLKNAITGYQPNIYQTKKHISYFIKNQDMDLLFIIFPSRGWYLVSLPLVVADNSPATLFPMAQSVLYWSNDQYIPATTIENGKGYWLNIAEPSTAFIEGTPLTEFSSHYTAGWHLIGSVMDTVNFSSLEDTPDGSIFPPLFRWINEQQNYNPSNFIEQSYGHWLAVLQECDLTVKKSLNMSTINTEDNQFPLGLEWSIPMVITISDSLQDRVTFGTKENATDQLNRDIDMLNPPAAPDMFDAFFQIEHSLFPNLTADTRADTSKVMTWKLNIIQTNGNNGTITWDTTGFPKNGDRSGLLQILQNGNVLVDMFAVDSLDFTGDQTFTIYADLSDFIGIEKDEVGKVMDFRLGQNYPNPFNAATKIFFELGQGFSGENVNLSIYNLSGQLVRVLINEVKMPGYHEIVWDGLNDFDKRVSSGVYIYKISVNGFKSTKKMVLIY